MAHAQKIIPFMVLALAAVPVWGQGAKSPAPKGPEVVEAPRVITEEANTGVQPVDPKSYLIGPEDVLKIEVYKDQDMSRIVNVRPDGKITMPYVGDLQAEGLTPERLASQLKEALAALIKNPDVSVSVLAVNSKSFTVTGRVNRVGRVPLVTPMRVFDAIGLSGGFQEFANQKDVQIVRGSERLHFNYKDFLKKKKEAVEQNIWLQNGDTIVVK